MADKIIASACAKFDLFRGLNAVVRAIERGNVNFVVLASDCNESRYVALIEKLCADKNITLNRSMSDEELARAAGLCRTTSEGEVVLSTKHCSVVGATATEEEIAALNVE